MVEAPGNEKDDTPKSFVFKMGKVPAVVQNLVQDMRRVMAPYTADNLREKRCVLLVRSGWLVGWLWFGANA